MSDYYHYQNSCCGTAHAYLLPSLSQIFANLAPPEKRIFDLGCGNGSIANWLSEKGFQVSGCDPSESGIAEAKKAYPELDLYVGSAYDDLASKFGNFPLLISLEVVEHVYAPRDYAKTVYNLLQPGGYALISTPYHSYLKNLALAATGKMDEHFTALWDHGHIKFWSVKTMTKLLTEANLSVEKIYRIGRIAPLAKTMIILARRGQ
ncbi:MAG: methyltransferase domain-containing protein [Microcystis sp. M04BS1]|jgi:2-polyprenyl-6-hydroxyphenyl methylase/3-demethylubiquinone-9 3-methyltransferase|uniref:class I SAM-dependent methyltransferase n=1 Tax=Microcystis aeruginosa TaxID=1126 RepID=UPI002330EA07|nr:methyltransferase domain-containing protein [Microcystis aeruginosa]MCA2554200.1 methyltransferase domain-containing protein [Microcystis sp. M04BS1]MDB9506623.1 methyltransferase domain-containing protein [Microcystis aeruginosa CS-338/01]